MSELKRHHINEVMDMHNLTRGKMGYSFVYYADEADKVIARHKYKRCLAMARMCEERSARYDVLQERHDLDWGREIEFYYRWYKRWLELAERFKEEK